jgi:hypothetical protein
MRTLKLFLGLAGLLASSTAFAGVPGWVVSESSGQVSILSAGVSKVVHRGGAVAVGETVSTGANGRAVLVRGEEYLIVSPNTRIRVVDPARSGGMTQIMELFGNTIFRIKKMATPHFGVQTPYLAAVVKGTTFSVTVTDKGASVQVVEGRVEVSTSDGGASYMVLPGDIASVAANAPMQLSVAGRETKTITSTGPNPDAPAVAPEPEEPTPAATPVADTETPANTIIVEAVGEGPVRLEALSGGMVKGDTTLVAMTTVAATSEAAAPPVPTSTVADPVVTAVDPVTAVVDPVTAVVEPGKPVVEPVPPTPVPSETILTVSPPDVLVPTPPTLIATSFGPPSPLPPTPFDVTGGPVPPSPAGPSTTEPVINNPPPNGGLDNNSLFIPPDITLSD